MYDPTMALPVGMKRRKRREERKNRATKTGSDEQEEGSQDGENV